MTKKLIEISHFCIKLNEILTEVFINCAPFTARNL